MRDYIGSLERLETMVSGFDEIWPSHADIPVSPDILRKLLDGAEKILNHEAEGTPVQFFGREILAYDLGFATFLCNPQ